MAVQPIGFRASKRLGQNFLVDDSVARREASYAAGKRAVELGPGTGALTARLCEVASSVVAVEKDQRLCEALRSSMSDPKLRLVCGDFFKTEYAELGEPEIMVSNIPYNMSSKTIDWLAAHRMEAVICAQKEFAERMLAGPGTGEYSKLSVITALQFSVEKLMDVPAGAFRPVPKVDSIVLRMTPLSGSLDRKYIVVIGALMSHKNRKVRNAIEDSASPLGLSKASARRLGDEAPHSGMRLFELAPAEILKIASYISAARVTE
ncbi:MAG: 16S rRNA (adenine(1518)-N(6)/adenine(1519)-N(6))-dimethyltransferase RsmA [Candidatus Marsarchaeota archaeon]|jgi:16S rRNA (adenine1518-N6/adenine1519-N6)-dimethyltransferase|nr:16S rRNA (adenine(1518)-N(6)/adenine(1519)-N(6))-dimethyltransferase RsmA [Candidatus Marsarchaeota archaeon]